MGGRELATTWTLMALAASASAQSVADAAPRTGTWPHQPGARHSITLAAGDHLDAGTCDVPGARVDGDTVLRLLGPDGDQIAMSDDGCFGNLCSRLGYHVPFRGDGVYVVVAECYGGGGGCDGDIAYRVEARGIPAGPAPLRVSIAARALVGVDAPGGGLLADAVVEAEVTDWLTLRFDGGPLGLAGGAHGGIVGGAALASVIFDLDAVAFGGGVGVGALGYRAVNLDQREAVILGARVRLGDLTGFHVGGDLRSAVVAEDLVSFAFRAEARLPLGDVDLSLRAAGGDDGVALGEAVVTVWLERAPDRPVFGVSVHAGGGGVFYEPLCRFGAVCRDARWYVGPVLGAGIEWRP